ncbi:MAG: nitrilase-related carbon-nitrogen hydrolase [Thermodesulfobacteriota bacterium]
MDAHDRRPSQATLRVGIAQMNPVLGDIEANIESHLDFMEKAKAKRVQLLLFPELSLTGYWLGKNTIDVALNNDAAPILKLAEKAHGLHTVFGFVEEGTAAQFYNACAVVYDGKLLYVHRKLNLATYGRLEEGKYFGSGRYIETFPIIPPWNGSVLICADLWNPALIYLASLSGATILLAPTNSAVDAVSSEFSNLRGWKIVTRYCAMIYGMPILMANRVGVEDEMQYWGGSQVVDPFGNSVAMAEDESEQLIVADLDYASVRKARHQLPTVRDSNLELVNREINRIADYSGIPPGRKTT